MPSPKSTAGLKDDCTLFSIMQYECTPDVAGVTCWPLERVFRQCGKGPAIEVTNALIPNQDRGEGLRVDPGFIEKPPKGKSWADLR